MLSFFYKIIVITCFLIPALSVAADENKILVNGQFRVRVEGDNKTDMLIDRDFSSLRIRPQIKFIRDETLDVFFTPQFIRVMGESVLSPSTTTTNSKIATSGSTTDPAFNVHEAYAHYHPNDWFSFKAGRIVLSYGDELVIGALDWNNTARAFDAFYTRFKTGKGWTDLFASKITENNSATATAPIQGDINFYGLYNNLNFGDYLKNLDLYLLYQSDATGSRTSHLGVSGVRVASKFDSLDYRAEFTKEFGNAFTDTKNSQLDSEVGYTFEHSIKPRLGFEYFNAGKAYQQLYPTVHKWLGYADLLGRRNIAGYVMHVEAQVSDALKAKFDYHSFSRVDSSAPIYKLGGTAWASASNSNNVGTEFDLTAIYQASKDLKFTGGASLFNSGSYFEDQFGNVNPTFYYAQMEVNI